MNRDMSDRPHEKCAVVGVSTAEKNSDAARIAYQGLFALQHRGVEGSGIVATGGRVLKEKRGPGMVRDVYSEADMNHLNGSIAVGHNRYSTHGDKYSHLQPVISEAIGAAFAHNGTIPDTDALKKYLTERRYHTEQYNDSELFGQALFSKLHGGRDFPGAILEVSQLAIGAYACVATHGGTLVGFRDPHGIRPLELGQFEGGLMLASETCAFDTVGAEHVRSIEPGELVMIRGDQMQSTQFAEPDLKLDAFELVYFARHDSVMAGQRVNEIRRRFGEELAILHPPWQSDHDSILVTPVPDTSVPAAEAYAQSLGLRHETAIIKNRFIGRTFMRPTHASRHDDLRLKHTMIPERIEGRDLYMIDDSIVRGNTLPRLVKLARHLGARSVSVLIASPPIRYPDFYGVDTPNQDELMAAKLTVDQMRNEINADYLGFLSVSALVNATRMPRDELNLSAFTGEYPASIGKQARTVGQPISLEYVE
ncbi:MAG: amidophosphoribosyltransferase [Candidatus Nomurabacteria bacterium]|nr:MAG: amidophosphoribosyltransferase [Candidatus Nomurabacteria bacterium]